MPILSAADLGIVINFGRNQSGDILQRWDGDGWRDYKVDGKTVKAPVDIEALPHGEYRLFDHQ